MSGVAYVLLSLWIVAAAVSFAAIRDVLSPDKLIILALGIFFADIFITPYPPAVQIAYGLLLLTFVVAVVGLSPLVRSAAADTPRRVLSRTGARPMAAPAIGHTFFWIISIPALVAQTAMIARFGGIEGYISVLALRVIEFEGLGWLTAIVQTFSIVDLLYFSFVVTLQNPRRVALALYGMHLLVFVVLALLTGSRGSLLVNFVLMTMVHHYLVKRASLRWLAAVAASALLLASVLEVAREGVGVGAEGLVTGLSESKKADSSLSFAWTTYGTLSLALVLGDQNVKLHYGVTYLTWATNVIPRAFWPNKPDTGGNVLTKEYTGDAWGGSSYLSTGILPEAMLNFGQAAGLLVGLLQLALMLGLALILYVRYKRRFALRGPYDFIYGVRFAYFSWAMMALIVGEFTNVMMTLTIQLLTVWLVFKLIKSRGLANRPLVGRA